MKIATSLFSLLTLALGNAGIHASVAGGLDKKVIQPSRIQFRISQTGDEAVTDCKSVYDVLEKYRSRGCFQDADGLGCESALVWLKFATVTNPEPSANKGRLEAEFVIQDELEVPLSSYEVENRFDREYATLISMISAEGELSVQSDNGVDLNALFKRMNAGLPAEIKSGARGQHTLSVRNKLILCEMQKGSLSFRTRATLNLSTENAIGENRGKVLERVVNAVENLKKSETDDLDRYFRLGLEVADALTLTPIAQRTVEEKVDAAVSLERLLMRHDLRKFTPNYRTAAEALKSLEKSRYEVGHVEIELKP
jgi:hypothetical protein